MSKTTKKHVTRVMTYSKADVENALAEIKKGMSIRNASKIFQIPRTTLLYKHTGKSPISAKKGPALVLTDKEESQLVQWFMNVSAKGFTVTKQQLLDSVQILVNKVVKRKTPFCDGRPGRHWYEKYIRRHPNLSQKIEENSGERRAPLSEERIKKWFLEVKKLLYEKDLLDIHPSRIFTCDEAAFFLNPEGDKTIIQRGSKTVHNLAKSNDKECLISMFTANAAGNLAPPMVMFRYQRTPYSITTSIPDDWAHGNSENGWMNGRTFYDYITEDFYPWLLENKFEFPIVLFLDKHSSNMTMSLSNFCAEKNIEVIPLHPNATHIIQPLDVAFFRPMKSIWKHIIDQWNIDNFGRKFRKENFSFALKQAVDFVYDVENLRNGFMDCGLCPFSPEAINYSLIKDSAAYKEFRLLGSKSPADECADKSERFLHLFEMHLPDDKLTLFKENEHNPLWAGDEKDTNLFYFWMNVKMLANTSIDSIMDM
ncbi:uncharacterized protein LOC117177211 [Belonocnema kinseyi]|uniref:uncharacterized protein LOC117177211 n=1 Tax=Belonocnema kinseyi TaxID=2817044 RepID=UPI00143D7F78|nr:uncharacterized protein LOC117177211 [Belonocnema kinseyi]XP_033223649.1 uncharacterized protein LOC117177211 [Belonocnema kinseyi]